MSYAVYILRCGDGTYYIGKSKNLEKRLREHNGELAGGAKYTRGRRPVVLLYSQHVETTNEALKLEWKLKKLTRSEKEELIKTSNQGV